MATLSEALPGTKLTAPVRRTEIAGEDDDLTTTLHRQLIGCIGLALPITVVVIAAIFPNGGANRWEVLGSISGYYYTAAVSVFVGLLAALALFLFAYRGYKNGYQWADRTAAIVAGIAALGVAAVPTNATAGASAPLWWDKPAAYVHYGAAVLLFTMFAVYCLWLFRRQDPRQPQKPDKAWRNRVYLVCGLVIVGSMLWAGYNGWKDRDIFLPEAVALVAFSTSWLIKGAVHRRVAAMLPSRRA